MIATLGWIYPSGVSGSSVEDPVLKMSPQTAGIDKRQYSQVKDSNKCPEGDLPTCDTHLRHLASVLAPVVLAVATTVTHVLEPPHTGDVVNVVTYASLTDRGVSTLRRID